jgi:MFS family permease
MAMLSELLPPEFRSAVDGPLRRWYLTTLTTCFGFGLTLSMYVVYLHNVRHFSVSFATGLLAVAAVAGIASAPLWGTITDKFGPVPSMLASGFLSTVALAFWVFSHTRLGVAIAGIAIATFSGSGWGSASTMLTRLVPAEHRQRAFALNFMLVNLGIGLAGLVSASIVSLSRPVTFTELYCGNIAVTTLSMVLVATQWRHGGPVTEHHDDPEKAAEGWREVLQDRQLIRFALAQLFLALGGYGTLEAGFSLFVVDALHLSVRAIGLSFFFNTSTIVVAQLFTARRLEGKSRTRVIAVASLLWASFWLLLGGDLALSAGLAVGALCVAQVIFALGETVISPLSPALLNDLAPEHLRGRYNTLQGLTFGLSATVAPLLVALFFDTGLRDLWPFAMAGVVLVGGLLTLNLRHHLTPAQDGRTNS